MEAVDAGKAKEDPADPVLRVEAAQDTVETAHQRFEAVRHPDAVSKAFAPKVSRASLVLAIAVEAGRLPVGAIVLFRFMGLSLVFMGLSLVFMDFSLVLQVSNS